MSAVDDRLLERVRRRLATADSPVTPARLAAAVRAEGGRTGDAAALGDLQRVQDEVLGAGPLAPLLRDPSVTDVLVNAPDEVWVERGAGLERADVSFPDDAEVRRLVQRLVAPTGRRLDAAHPYVDARLPDGTRLHAVLPPLARRGTTLSLRTLRRQHLSLDDLTRLDSLDPPMARLLEAVVAARLAVVVSGGTGSGKTTLLSCLLGQVAPGERVVVVEDAAELAPSLSHLVLLEARPPNVERQGEVTVRELVRQAMRMRPDRLVVGETRGPEVVDVLAALNTGHDGGLTTVHANSAGDVVPRLEALAAAAGLDRPALHAQVVAGVQVVVHLRREADGGRSVEEVAVLRRGTDGWAVTVPAVVRRPGPVIGPVRAGVSRPAAGAAALRALLADRRVPVPGLLAASAAGGRPDG